MTARRLERSRLLDRGASLVETASAVCGVQAQVGLAAELAFGMRVDGSTRNDVRSALWERRELVKTWSLRGTLHVHPSDELPLWIAAAQVAGPRWHDERRLEPFGMRREQADAILDAIVDALDGRTLTREELGDEVAARVGPWAKEETEVIQFGKPAVRWPQLLGAAVEQGHLCFGPPQGPRSTYVRSDQWLDGWRELDPEASFAEAFRRYLAAYGPASVDDFAHWFGGRAARDAARRLPERLAGELEPVEVESYRGWLLAGDDQLPEQPAEAVRLLPHYDCFVIGAAPPGRPREHLIPPAAGNRIFDRGAGPNPVLLVDGIVGGTWSRKARGRHIEVRVELFSHFPHSRRRMLQAEVDRIGRFLGADAQLLLA